MQGIVIGFISVFSEIYTTKKHIEAPSYLCDFEVIFRKFKYTFKILCDFEVTVRKFKYTF